MIACKQNSASYLKSAEAYALTTVVLFNAFISCWDENCRSNLIRPETVIYDDIDSDCKPTLQTPPFPEHTSGHSVISSAVALTLIKKLVVISNLKILEKLNLVYLPEISIHF